MVHQSWPLGEQAQHFELGLILNSAVADIIEPFEVGALGVQHSGLWECNLADDSLIWSGGVYDIFGLPRGAVVTRDEALGFYSERSRATMERLRSYAIRKGCGFTLDAEILPGVGGCRWMRIIGAPVFSGNGTRRLHGLKLIV
jgi:hypothetical protein